MSSRRNRHAPSPTRRRLEASFGGVIWRRHLKASFGGVVWRRRLGDFMGKRHRERSIGFVIVRRRGAVAANGAGRQRPSRTGMCEAWQGRRAGEGSGAGRRDLWVWLPCQSFSLWSHAHRKRLGCCWVVAEVRMNGVSQSEVGACRAEERVGGAEARRANAHARGGCETRRGHTAVRGGGQRTRTAHRG